jgi:uncharacterized protein (TIGR00730 family)
MNKRICVYCSSSDAVDNIFFDTAITLGKLIAANRCSLVYGGTSVGLMGALARSVREHGGQVTGIIPEAIMQKGIAYEDADELIVTKDLRERKAQMELRADALVALPGGFGTLEEILEMITLKQLQIHSKPVIFINTNHFYDPLIRFFDTLVHQKFAKRESEHLYYMAPSPESIFSYIRDYRPVPIADKWFTGV